MIAAADPTRLADSNFSGSSPVMSSALSLDGGYDATRDRGRRSRPKSRIVHEDDALKSEDRRILIATTHDLQRNFEIARWAISKHLDFVSSFTFRSTTGDDRIDDQVNKLIAAASRKENFDAAGRHRRQRWIRLFEARACVDGDILGHKLASGHMQAVEGDRVRNPQTGLPAGFNIRDFTHGLRTGPAGRAMAWIVCQRKRGHASSYEFERVIPARFMIHHAYFDRFDQYRGVSPIASAVNRCRDIYEGADFALAKMKVAQLFGLVFNTKDDEPVGETSHANEGDGETPAHEYDKSKYEVDLGRGLWKVEIEDGEKVELIESKNPSQEFQAFMTVMIAVALKALDIPFSFFNESFTNFYGSRGALMQYLKSCQAKRENLIEVLDDWAAWRLGLYAMDELLELPAGMTVADLRWQWIPNGVEWWDKAKEVRGDAMAVAAGFDTFEAVVQRTGAGTGDIYDNIKRNKKVMEFARKEGVNLVLPGASGFDPEPAPGSGDGNAEGGDDA